MSMSGSYTNPRIAQGDTSIDYAYIAKCTESKDYDPEYKKLAMWDQLGKILDSQDNPFPRDWVESDDGEKISGITPKDAINIRKTALMLKPADRNEFLHRIQQAKGFGEILEYVRSK